MTTRGLPGEWPRWMRTPHRGASRLSGALDHSPGRPLRPRLVGVNHVALEVDDVDAALDWYGRIFELTLRGRVPGAAFVDMGDQFLAISEGRKQPPDDGRHFGLVVDDKEAARKRLVEAGARLAPGRRLDFYDPWGNRVEVVDYRDVQFTKAPSVASGMGIGGLEKRESALEELREKGLAPDQASGSGE